MRFLVKSRFAGLPTHPLPVCFQVSFFLTWQVPFGDCVPWSEQKYVCPYTTMDGLGGMGGMCWPTVGLLDSLSLQITPIRCCGPLLHQSR